MKLWYIAPDTIFILSTNFGFNVWTVLQLVCKLCLVFLITEFNRKKLIFSHKESSSHLLKSRINLDWGIMVIFHNCCYFLIFCTIAIWTSILVCWVHYHCVKFEDITYLIENCKLYICFDFTLYEGYFSFFHCIVKHLSPQVIEQSSSIQSNVLVLIKILDLETSLVLKGKL